jgi:hypothetical protein
LTLARPWKPSICDRFHIDDDTLTLTTWPPTLLAPLHDPHEQRRLNGGPIGNLARFDDQADMLP